jgi:hypothetical protein
MESFIDKVKRLWFAILMLVLFLVLLLKIAMY